MSFQDHYSAFAASYARARPEYPPALFRWLRTQAPAGGLAWDAGTGSGQAARGLVEVFERVVATDPSGEQLAQAPAHPRISYYAGSEIASGLVSGSADCVTAAQAAHWFDMEGFAAEARRSLRRGGLVAVWGYGLCRVSEAVDLVLDRFYLDVVGPHWPPERRHVDTAYRELPFPFTEVAWPPIAMEREWTLPQLLGYLDTWSAVHRYRQALGTDPLGPLVPELRRAWGASDAVRRVAWPLFGRAGRT